MNDNKKTREVLKQLPSIDKLLQIFEPKFPLLFKPLLKEVISGQLKSIRSQVIKNKSSLDLDHLYKEIENRLLIESDFKMKSVINGTGVVLHTGLGRAPISKKILLESFDRVFPYTNIELDLNNGKRGDRTKVVSKLISSISRMDDAIVVNNNAAALLLILNTFSENKEVVISRGQQVEIGGTFRIPDVISKARCNMVEIGTTNKTHLTDYQKAINSETGTVLFAHTSNYKVVGFTNEVSIKELGSICKKNKKLLVVDIGCGAVIDFSKFGLPYEKTVDSYTKDGADIICFSGDKLLGGPQCGIIAASNKAIEQIKSNPLYRALRCDKYTYALLESTLRTILKDDEVSDDNLTFKMLFQSKNDLKKTVKKIIKKIKKEIVKEYDVKEVDTTVEAGSGSLPLQKIDSCAIRFTTTHPDRLKKQFLKSEYPMLGYIKNNNLFFDFKSITNDQVKLIPLIINKVLA